MRRSLACAALAALALTPPAFAGALSSTDHGAVDFGDRVVYRVDGPNCENTIVLAAVVLPGGGGPVFGPLSQPLRDGIDPSGCVGAAEIPDYNAVTAAGWEQGDAIVVGIASNANEFVLLRYARVEVDQGTVAAGTPTVVPAQDPDTGANDQAVAMATGDSIALGLVDLRNVDSVALRVCPFGLPVPEPLRFSGSGGVIQPDRMEPVPLHVSLRQDSPTGPVLVGPVDVTQNLLTGPRLSSEGYGETCYRLVSLELTGTPLGNAPELFLTADSAPEGLLVVNSIDFNGTGAKHPVRTAPDVPGMETIFDGTSFDGWTAAGCKLRDGAATNDRSGEPLQITGCSMTLGRSVRNVVLRVEARRRNFHDNGGIFLSQEIQLRSAGEYLPGGYFTEYAARWQKLNAWPAWSEFEIVQLGARYVVSVNGRTVTDHVASTGAPAPYQPRLLAQPEWSYRTGVAQGFGSESTPDLVLPKEWGHFEFRNVRLYECSSETDPICLALANARAGQAAPNQEGME